MKIYTKLTESVKLDLGLLTSAFMFTSTQLERDYAQH